MKSLVLPIWLSRGELDLDLVAPRPRVRRFVAGYGHRHRVIAPVAQALPSIEPLVRHVAHRLLRAVILAPSSTKFELGARREPPALQLREGAGLGYPNFTTSPSFSPLGARPLGV